MTQVNLKVTSYSFPLSYITKFQAGGGTEIRKRAPQTTIWWWIGKNLYRSSTLFRHISFTNRHTHCFPINLYRDSFVDILTHLLCVLNVMQLNLDPHFFMTFQQLRFYQHHDQNNKVFHCLVSKNYYRRKIVAWSKDWQLYGWAHF